MGFKKCDMIITLGRSQWTETHYLPSTVSMDDALTALVSLSNARSYCFALQTDFDEIRVSDVSILGDSTVETRNLGGYGAGLPADSPAVSMMCRADMTSLHRSTLFLRGQPRDWVNWSTNFDEAVWTPDFAKWADAYFARLMGTPRWGAIAKLRMGETGPSGATATPAGILTVNAFPVGAPAPYGTTINTPLPITGKVAGDKIVIRGARNAAKPLNGTWPLAADPAADGIVIPVPFNSIAGFTDADLSKAKAYWAIYDWFGYTKITRRQIRGKKYGVQHDLPRGRARTR